MIKTITRKIGLRALKLFGRDISITHHWVPGQKILLHSFKHKGYWWHGKNREIDTMKACAKLIGSGDMVIEVGSHIGYLTTYFAHLAGPQGRVLAFEPSDENARYLSANIKNLPNTAIDRRGIADFEGEATFFVETLTGQNNSLLKDYTVFDSNAKNAGVAATRQEVSIQVTTLDKACDALGLSPNFIKIDIEGSELEAVRGMMATLQKSRPIILIEITMHVNECVALFKSAGYRGYDERLTPATEAGGSYAPEFIKGTTNFFFIPDELANRAASRN